MIEMTIKVTYDPRDFDAEREFTAAINIAVAAAIEQNAKHIHGTALVDTDFEDVGGGMTLADAEAVDAAEEQAAGERSAQQLREATADW